MGAQSTMRFSLFSKGAQDKVRVCLDRGNETAYRTWEVKFELIVFSTPTTLPLPLPPAPSAPQSPSNCASIPGCLRTEPLHLSPSVPATSSSPRIPPVLASSLDLAQASPPSAVSGSSGSMTSSTKVQLGASLKAGREHQVAWHLPGSRTTATGELCLRPLSHLPQPVWTSDQNTLGLGFHICKVGTILGRTLGGIWLDRSGAVARPLVASLVTAACWVLQGSEAAA